MKEKIVNHPSLTNREIILGITGGIAVYKAVEVLRLLVKQGASVRVIMTRHATEFVQPLTFAALSGQDVIVEMFGASSAQKIDHVKISETADLLCIVPATANIVGKLVSGIADDFLSTLFLSTRCPVVIAPAMNTYMYENPVVQRNLDTLRSLGITIIEPTTGDLACRDKGMGRLVEPDEIVDVIEYMLTGEDKFKDKIFLVTAGPTREFLDPIRFVGNRSSGKMGYALAGVLRSKGAKVILVSGPTGLIPPRGVEFHQVNTAMEMLETMDKVMEPVTHVIMVAAVADYRPKTLSHQKLKKEKPTLTIELEKNPDILETLVPKYPDKTWVGFAAETDNLLENARIKLERKNLDMIIANQVSPDGYPMEAETNTVLIIDKYGTEKILPQKPKSMIAREISELLGNMKKDGV